jgi:hypothetical protein
MIHGGVILIGGGDSGSITAITIINLFKSSKKRIREERNPFRNFIRTG